MLISVLVVLFSEIVPSNDMIQLWIECVLLQKNISQHNINSKDLTVILLMTLNETISRLL